MSRAFLVVVVLFVATFSFGQCAADQVQGTSCAGPIKTTVKPGQSPTSFTDFYPATVQWPCLKAPTGFFRLCATGGYIAVDFGDGQGYLNLRGRDGVDGKDGTNGRDGIDGKPGDRGPQGVPGVIVGTVQVMNLVCPKGKGTVQAGLSIVGCTSTTTAVH